MTVGHYWCYKSFPLSISYKYQHSYEEYVTLGRIYTVMQDASIKFAWYMGTCDFVRFPFKTDFEPINSTVMILRGPFVLTWINFNHSMDK